MGGAKVVVVVVVPYQADPNKVLRFSFSLYGQPQRVPMCGNTEVLIQPTTTSLVVSCTDKRQGAFQRKKASQWQMFWEVMLCLVHAYISHS